MFEGPGCAALMLLEATAPAASAATGAEEGAPNMAHSTHWSRPCLAHLPAAATAAAAAAAAVAVAVAAVGNDDAAAATLVAGNAVLAAGPEEEGASGVDGGGA